MTGVGELALATTSATVGVLAVMGTVAAYAWLARRLGDDREYVDATLDDILDAADDRRRLTRRANDVHDARGS